MFLSIKIYPRVKVKDIDKNKIKIVVPLLYAHSTIDKPTYEYAHKHNLNLKKCKTR